MPSLADYLAMDPRPSDAEIGRQLGISKDAVYRKRRQIDNPAVAEWEERRDRAEEDVQRRREVTDFLRVVELPPVPPVRLRYTPASCAIVSSDHHWPVHDPKVESIILQAIEVLRPKMYVLNGDGPDMLALSKYPKDARFGKSWALRDEQWHAKNWWREVWSRMQAWDGELYETEANHSGQGQASRWRRYMDNNAAALHGLDGFEQLNRYETYFHPKDVPVQMVEEVVIARDMRVRHGEIVRKDGGYSAKAHGEKWGSSVMHGHTHRIGSSVKRRPGISGVRPDEFTRTFETGCACLLDADYCPGANWQQGFAVIQIDESLPGGYGVEQIQIINGRATSATLRGTLAA